MSGTNSVSRRESLALPDKLDYDPSPLLLICIRQPWIHELKELQQVSLRRNLDQATYLAGFPALRDTLLRLDVMSNTDFRKNGHDTVNNAIVSIANRSAHLNKIGRAS